MAAFRRVVAPARVRQHRPQRTTAHGLERCVGRELGHVAGERSRDVGLTEVPQLQRGQLERTDGEQLRRLVLMVEQLREDGGRSGAISDRGSHLGQYEAAPRVTAAP